MGYGTLIQRIVYKVSGRPLASSGLYTPSDYMYDYALGGVPFLSATSDTRPDTEGPVQQRKDQFDNYKDPGEYSLNQWWLRSQSSFVGGAGVIYQDPDTQGEAKNIRFNRSVGIDPFTDPDNLQLLKQVNKSVNYTSSATPGPLKVLSYMNGTNQNRLGILAVDGAFKSSTMTSSDVSGGFATATIGASATYADPITYHDPNNAVNANPMVIAWSADNSVPASYGMWRIFDSGGGALTATRIYTAPGASTPIPVMAVARGTVYVGIANKLYLIDPYAGASTAWPAAIAQVPADQTIISITDGPDGVYVAANGDNAGYIHKSTFDSSGIVNGLSQVAILPNGELINYIAAYVATYMVITTVSGIRVAVFSGGGLSYGPPLLTVPIDSGAYIGGIGADRSGFGKVAFYGTYAFVTTQTDTSQHDGAQGIMCINLGVLVTDNNAGAEFNSYSSWVYSPLSIYAVSDIAVMRDGQIVYTTNQGTGVGQVHDLWVTHRTNLIDSGYLDTGRCRFNTIEPKLFKYFSVRTPTPLQGEVSVAVLDDGGGITNYVTYGPTLEPGTDDIATPSPTGPHNWEALRFTLRRSGTDSTVGGKLDSWQIKALPGTLKQRNIVRQFLCFNSETDKTGQQIAGDTSALDRLTAIRQMCQRGDTVTLQDLVNNISDQVIVDDYQFTMLTTPGPNGENYGGYLTVKMRTVADSVPPISVAGSEEE